MSQKFLVNCPAWSGTGYLQSILRHLGISEDLYITDHILHHYDNGFYPLWNGHYKKLVEDEGYKSVLLYRDPRDMMVSAGMRMDEEPSKRCIYPYHKREKIQKDIFVDFLKSGQHRGWMSFDDLANDLRFFYGISYSFKLSYEQLVFRPVETITKLMSFIEHPLDEESISECLSAIPRTGRVGQWVRQFDEDIETVFKMLGGDIVSFLGYEPNENWSCLEYMDDGFTEREYWESKHRKLFP